MRKRQASKAGAVTAGLLLALEHRHWVSADSADGGKELPCDVWYMEHDVPGANVLAEEAASTRDQCLPLCAELEGCTAMSFVEATLKCSLKNPAIDAQPQQTLGTDVYRLCGPDTKPPAGAPRPAVRAPATVVRLADVHGSTLVTVADCGVWMEHQDYFGSDIFDRRAESRDECLQYCASTPNCNAVTYDPHVDPAICYMKNLLNGHLRDWRPEWPLASYRLCGNESGAFQQGGQAPLGATAFDPAAVYTPPSAVEDAAGPGGPGGGDRAIVNGCTSSECEEAATQPVCGKEGCEGTAEGENKLSDGIIAAIASGGALIVLLLAAWIFCLCCRSKRAQQAKQVQEKPPSSFAVSLLSSTESASVNRSLAHSHAPSHYRSTSARSMSNRTGSTDSSTCAVQLPGTLPVHKMNGMQGKRATAKPGLNPHRAYASRFTADSSAVGSPRELHLSDYASTWHVPTLPLPSEGASKADMMSFVHNQLDRIEASLDPRHSEVLDGLVLLGSGPRERLQGGQAIVQMALSQATRREYAMKFFICRDSFDLERALYSGDNPLGQFLPEVKHIVDNEDRRLVDPSGVVLPPCIVMEAGESLDLWSSRNAPDRAQTFVVVYHIAQRLAELHAARYVHRDLKPGNVMWLPRRNRWTLIDFGCCISSGENAPLGYTLRYAAPEVVRALRKGENSMTVRESQDAWSLGVMAFELATGAAAFPAGMDPEKIKDQIQGVNGTVLPWEGERLTERVKSQLRLFQDALLQLLHRDPLQRPSMAQFCRTCSCMLGGETQ